MFRVGRTGWITSICVLGLDTNFAGSEPSMQHGECEFRFKSPFSLSRLICRRWSWLMPRMRRRGSRIKGTVVKKAYCTWRWNRQNKDQIVIYVLSPACYSVPDPAHDRQLNLHPSRPGLLQELPLMRAPKKHSVPYTIQLVWVLLPSFHLHLPATFAVVKVPLTICIILQVLILWSLEVWIEAELQLAKEEKASAEKAMWAPKLNLVNEEGVPYSGADIAMMGVGDHVLNILEHDLVASDARFSGFCIWGLPFRLLSNVWRTFLYIHPALLDLILGFVPAFFTAVY